MMRPVFVLLILAFSASCSAGSSLVLTADEIENTNRGAEYIISLADKVAKRTERRLDDDYVIGGEPLSIDPPSIEESEPGPEILTDAEVFFVGFEMIRSIHLTFKVYTKHLAASASAQSIGESSEAMEEYEQAVEPLSDNCEALVKNVDYRFPIALDRDTLGSDEVVGVAKFAIQKMLEMTREDVYYVMAFFTPGTVTTILVSGDTERSVNIELVEFLAVMLQRVTAMTEWLSIMTREDSIRAMQSKIIEAVTIVQEEVKEVLGSEADTQALEQRLSNSIYSCTKYGSMLEEYKKTGVWGRGAQAEPEKSVALLRWLQEEPSG